MSKKHNQYNSQIDNNNNKPYQMKKLVKELCADRSCSKLEKYTPKSSRPATKTKYPMSPRKNQLNGVLQLAKYSRNTNFENFTRI